MHSKNTLGYYKHFDFFVWDLICMQLAYSLSYYFLFNNGLPYKSIYYMEEAVLLAMSQIIIFLAFIPYKNILKRSKYVELRETLVNAIEVMVLNLIVLFVLHWILDMSRLLIGWTAVSFLILSYGIRILWKRFIRRRLTAKTSDSMIIVTKSDYIEELKKNIPESPLNPYEVTKVFVTDYKEIEKREFCEYTVGSIEELYEYAPHNAVSSAFIYLPYDIDLQEKYVSKFLEMGITAHSAYCPLNRSVDEGDVYGERIGRYLVATSMIRVVPVHQLILKRLIDILGGLVGCIMTLCIYVFVAPAIYFKDPGPIFFSQKRIGKNGKIFKMYKFRSMYTDAEERKKALMEQNKIKDGLMFKMDDDPRIIGSEKKDKNGNPKGIGNFIRNTSLDEFPQFWNVLKGDMSLVGTRPPTLDEYEKYDLHHRVRMAIKPGITGMWQVSGRSKITDFEEVVRLDKWYIQNWTLWLDIKIILKTILVVFKHDGAE